MNKKIIPLLLASTVILTACNENQTTEDNAPVSKVTKEDAIAVVNGTYISKEALTTLENEITQRSRGQSYPKDKLIDELVQRELLVQDAVKKQLYNSEDYINQLETIKASLLSQAAIKNHLKSNPVTDVDLKAEYDKNVAAAGTEYKARHILVKTEAEAIQLIAELNKGADFAELAKAKSTGPSGPQGGDLGWFAAGQMVAPFSEAVIALEDNKFTATAVQTQFGYHVILREASRAQTPPPFESIKEQIRPMLQRQKMQSYLDSLRTNAKVELLLPTDEATKEGATEQTVSEKKESTGVKESDKLGNAASSNKVIDKVSETAEKASDSLNKVTEKATDSVNSATTNVTDIVKKVVTTVDETAKDGAAKVTESITNTIDSVIP